MRDMTTMKTIGGNGIEWRAEERERKEIEMRRAARTSTSREFEIAKDKEMDYYFVPSRP